MSLVAQGEEGKGKDRGSKELAEAGMSYRQAEIAKKETVWESLDKITLAQAVELFLKSFRKNTAVTYSWSFKYLFGRRFLEPGMSLKEFALMNLDARLDFIKERQTGAEATKQGRAAAFISLTSFLQRKTEGLIRKAVPNKEKGRKTFVKIREKTVYEALKQEELEAFLGALRGVSLRNYLVGAMQTQGAKRISEVLGARIEDIDWKEGKIRFRQKKSEVLEKETVVFFPVKFMEGLREYLQGREAGPVFITSTGKQMTKSDIQQIFTSAFRKAGIRKRGLSHLLRATTITELSRRGFRVEEIANLTGHADLKMVSYYDHSDLENNPSRRTNMI